MCNFYKKSQRENSTRILSLWLFLCRLREQGSDKTLELLDAVGADVLALVVDYIAAFVTEYAGRLILVQNNIVAFNKYFKSISFGDIQGAAKLDGQNDTQQLVNFSNNSGGLHCNSSYD